MTTTDAEIVHAARNLHDQIRHAVCGQAQDSFDHPTPFDPGKPIFHHHARTGKEVMEAGIAHAHCVAWGFFLGCWVRTPAGA